MINGLRARFVSMPLSLRILDLRRRLLKLPTSIGDEDINARFLKNAMEAGVKFSMVDIKELDGVIDGEMTEILVSRLLSMGKCQILRPQ